MAQILKKQAQFRLVFIVILQRRSASHPKHHISAQNEGNKTRLSYFNFPKFSEGGKTLSKISLCQQINLRALYVPNSQNHQPFIYLPPEKGTPLNIASLCSTLYGVQPTSDVSVHLTLMLLNTLNSMHSKLSMS